VALGAPSSLIVMDDQELLVPAQHRRPRLDDDGIALNGFGTQLMLGAHLEVVLEQLLHIIGGHILLPRAPTAPGSDC